MKSIVNNWFSTVSHLPGPKFITGLRGTGKSKLLRAIDQSLKSEGIPDARRIWIDADDSWLRQYPTSQLLLERINSLLPKGGRNYLLIREVASLPDADTLVGALIGNRNLTVVATASSKRLLEQGLGRYLGNKFQKLELLPSDGASAYTREDARARWNEIFISDVLGPNIILETGLLNYATGWLSDHVGDPLSLRIISRAISPTRRELSPHTIERYLKALEDSHLIEKVQVMDAKTGVISKRNYEYFFTDPQLRIAKFGSAPEHEARRAQLNFAWLQLRHQPERIFCTLHDEETDFITIGETRRRWHVGKDGKLSELEG